MVGKKKLTVPFEEEQDTCQVRDHDTSAGLRFFWALPYTRNWVFPYGVHLAAS